MIKILKLSKNHNVIIQSLLFPLKPKLGYPICGSSLNIARSAKKFIV